MPRPSRLDAQREQLLQTVTEVFCEFGYRRTTTAMLAERCQVRENILYRLWADKKSMFLAAINDLFDSKARVWNDLLARSEDASDVAAILVDYEARHQGEFGFYRVVFTGLNETDDPDIKAALIDMYKRFHQLICKYIKPAQSAASGDDSLPVDSCAWALVGLATISNILRELAILKPRKRERVFSQVATLLLRNLL